MQVNELKIDDGGCLELPSGTSFPSSPHESDIFYRTDEKKLYVYNGTGWIEQIHHQADVTLAGTEPVDADVSGWAAGDRGHGIGTTAREFYMVKRGTAVKWTEMS